MKKQTLRQNGTSPKWFSKTTIAVQTAITARMYKNIFIYFQFYCEKVATASIGSSILHAISTSTVAFIMGDALKNLQEKGELLYSCSPIKKAHS